MCITTATHLNPNAEEWRPLQLHHLLPHLSAPPPPPPPPAFAAHPPHKLLMCHLPHKFNFHHPITLTMQPSCPHILYFPPPVPFPVAAPPLSHDKEKKKKGLEKYCVEMLEKTTVKRREPLRRLVWRPKRIVSDGGAAASPPPPPKKVPAARTTVMVRNIPNQLRRAGMLEFIDRYCVEHSLKYDFMYLPMDFRRDNLGYAFVNFTSCGEALKFKKIANNYRWGTVKTEKGCLYYSNKICAITWGRIQGKDSLVEKFEKSIFHCDNPDFLPVVFDPPRDGSNSTPPVTVGSIVLVN